MTSLYRILLIEDDPAVARSLKAGLERDSFVVTWKSTGSEGIAFANESNPHLILLDIYLPDGCRFTSTGNL